MSDEELALYQQDPIWPRRVAAVHTSLRELEAEEGSPGASLEPLGEVSIPVLQILGGDSLPIFAESTFALDERLRARAGRARSRAPGTPPTTPTSTSSWPRSGPSSRTRT